MKSDEPPHSEESGPEAPARGLEPGASQRDIRPRAGEHVVVRPRDKRMAWGFIIVMAAALALFAYCGRVAPG